MTGQESEAVETNSSERDRAGVGGCGNEVEQNMRFLYKFLDSGSKIDLRAVSDDRNPIFLKITEWSLFKNVGGQAQGLNEKSSRKFQPKRKEESQEFRK